MVIDPARQFSSGYVFNGNTAVNGYDEDGRAFVLDDFLIAIAFNAVMNTLMNTGDIHSWGDLGKYAGIGALNGALTYGVGSFAPTGALSGAAYGAGTRTCFLA